VPLSPHDLVRAADEAVCEVQPALEGMVAKKGMAEWVEGLDGAAGGKVACSIDTLLHLPGRPVRESEGEDLFRSGLPTLDEMKDLLGDHPGFSWARAGEDELTAW